MRWHKAALGWAAVFASGFVALTSPASPQTFHSYRCADGTRFVLAFYPGDRRAYLQIDGRAVTLKESLILPGRRYSGSGVSLTLSATGALIRHVRRPVTACELS